MDIGVAFTLKIYIIYEHNVKNVLGLEFGFNFC